jgi:DNA-binding transcriptional ArsR family regulator
MNSARGAEMCQVSCVQAEDVAHARSGLADDDTYRGLADLFAALADPTRARIVHALLHQELCTRDVAAVVGISRPGASQHLRVLRSLRLVKPRRAGKFVYYSLDDAHVGMLVQIGLTHHRDGGRAAAPTPVTAGAR